MNELQAAVLGIVQGVTEFFPISSSGHLVLIPRLLHWPDQGLLFDVTLHAGSLLALLVFFRVEIWNLFSAWVQKDLKAKESRRTGMLIVVGTIPAVLAGALLESFVSSIFRSAAWVGFWLMWIGILIIATQKFVDKSPDQKFDLKRALGMGFAQAGAILPGISRSGSTIWAGTLLGLTHEKAARFSFLLGMPAICAALVKQIWDLSSAHAFNSIDYLPLTIGFFVSALTSFVAIKTLLKILQNNTLRPFAVYMICLGAFVLLVL